MKKKKKNCNIAKPKIICSTFKEKKNRKKKIELKSEKKKIFWNRTKPTASPTEQTHPRILKKKKKQQHKIRNQTYPSYPRSRRCREYRENQSLIYWDNLYRLQFTKQKQNKPKAIYCVYKKKTKKNPIQSLCTKTAKPNQNPNTRSSVAVTRPSSSSP